MYDPIEASKKIGEINRVIERLETARSLINKSVEMRFYVQRDWGVDHEYCWPVIDRQHDIEMARYSCEHAAFREMARLNNE
jgi:hypothetical protein